MDINGLLFQVVFFFIFMLAANYFIMQRKHPNRLKVSFNMTAVAAVIYAIVMYFWGMS